MIKILEMLQNGHQHLIYLEQLSLQHHAPATIGGNMKLTDNIVNFGTEISFNDISKKLKDGKTITIFCPSRPVLKSRMDSLEREFNGQSFANYSDNQLVYKKGSAVFYILPEVLLKPRVIMSMRTDYYCNLCGSLEN